MKISAIICTFNRDKYLPEALKSIGNQTLPKEDYELIIVNNHSTDRTDEICRRFFPTSPGLNYTYLIEEQPGLSFARNRGITESRTSILAFIDDDAIAEPDYLTNAFRFMKNNPEVYSAGGKVIPVYGTGKKPEWLSKYIMGLVSAVDLGEKVREFPNNKYPVGANMIVRKAAFEKYGLFRTDLGRTGKNLLGGEEKDFYNKLKNDGKKIYYIPDTVVHHYIDAYRLQPEFIKNLCFKIGVSERILVKNEGWKGWIKVLLDYIFKLGASIVLSLLFLMKLKFLKAYYIIRVRWHIFLGFLIKKA